MAEKRYYWLKLNNDFFDGIKIKKLRKIAGGDTYTIIYLKLLLYAIDKEGILEYQGVEKTIGEELALAIDEKAEDVGLCINYLRSVGLAEVRTNAVLLPEAVEKTGSEGSSAKRMREKRAQSTSIASHCAHNVPLCAHNVPLCYGEIEKELDTDTEIDTEKDTELKKEDISNEISKKEKRFVKPAVEEVEQYIRENMFTVDAHKFVDYYDANGWLIGKNKMKDWKATVRNWERREQERFRENQKKGNAIRDFLNE